MARQLTALLCSVLTSGTMTCWASGTMTCWANATENNSITNQAFAQTASPVVASPYKTRQAAPHAPYLNSAFAAQSVALDGALTRLVQTPRIKPPAPGPQYLDPADYKRIKSLIDAIDRKSWRSAKTIITQIEDRDARSLGQWYYYDARDPNVSLPDGITFLDTHPDWPSLSRIQRHLEKQLSDATPTDLVYALFKTRDPISGSGKIHFIRTLMARGETEAAQIYLRDSWQNHRFTISDERRILSSYANLLNNRDHNAKVDQLLWARQVTNARRHFSRLDASERRMAEARAALYVRASNAERLYRALPQAERQDPGVVHAAIRYYRRGDREYEAINLVKTLADDPVALRNPSRFWDERNLLMRWALKNGRFMDAYEMANRHSLDDGLDLADAEFNAGWIALRFLEEPARAEQHFTALASWATSPISTARAYYWLGRAAAAQNKPDLARTRYSIAARYIYTYYGQLAAEEIGGALAEQKFVSTAIIRPEDRIRFDNRATSRAFRMISDLNDRRSLLRFSYHLDDQLETPGEYLLLSEINARESAPHLTIRAGKTAVRNDIFVPEMSYPLLTIPQGAAKFVAPEVVLGLSRQESEFNPRAYSSAGARGVMQLLPSTAQLTARKERLAYSRDALLSDASYNITIGSAHLSHLLDRFDGSFIMTFVGYNAGPHRATRWVGDYGDPRTDDVDPIDWVELIPFSETRNYVQRVHENIQIYRARLNNAPIAGQLSSDLVRGSINGQGLTKKRPSQTLDRLRPDEDRRPLPALSTRTAKRIDGAPLDLPAARARADHLGQQEQKSAPNAAAGTPTSIPDNEVSDPNPRLDGTLDQQPSNSGLISPQPANPQSREPLSVPALVNPGLKPPPSSPSIAPTPSGHSTTNAREPASIARGPSLSPKANLAKSNAQTPASPAPSSSQDCASYRAFVARNEEKQNESAENLNAAMLAELRGGSQCDPVKASNNDDKPGLSGPAQN